MLADEIEKVIRAFSESLKIGASCVCFSGEIQECNFRDLASELAKCLVVDKAKVVEKLDVWIGGKVERGVYLEDIDIYDLKDLAQALSKAGIIKVEEK